MYAICVVCAVLLPASHTHTYTHHPTSAAHNNQHPPYTACNIYSIDCAITLSHIHSRAHTMTSSLQYTGAKEFFHPLYRNNDTEFSYTYEPFAFGEVDAVVDVDAAVASPSSFCFGFSVLCQTFAYHTLKRIGAYHNNRDHREQKLTVRRVRRSLFTAKRFKFFQTFHMKVTKSENSLKNMAIIWLWAATLCVFGICAVIVPL